MTRPIKFKVFSRDRLEWADQFIKHVVCEDGTEYSFIAFKFGNQVISLAMAMESSGYEVVQSIGIFDLGGRELFEKDFIKVYQTEEMPDPDDYESIEDEDYKERLEESLLCTQEIKWSKTGGYYCDEDNGEFCPALGDQDELTLELIGSTVESPSLTKN